MLISIRKLAIRVLTAILYKTMAGDGKHNSAAKRDSAVTSDKPFNAYAVILVSCGVKLDVSLWYTARGDV